MCKPNPDQPGVIPIRTALALVFLGFLVLIGLSRVFAPFGLWGASLALALAMLGPLAALLYFNPSYRPRGSLAPPGVMVVLGALLLGSGFWLVLATGLSPVLEKLTSPEELQHLADTFADSGVPIAARVILVGLVPSICEELFFRGALQRSFQRRLSPLYSIIASSLLFGVFHLSPARFISSATLGLLLGYLSYRHRSLWPAILVHAANNTAAIIALSIFGEGVPNLLLAWCIPATLLGLLLVLRR